MPIISIKATEVVAGDELKTYDGYLKVGGVQSLRDGESIGLLTSEGMIGVGAKDVVTVKRDDSVIIIRTEPKTIISSVTRWGIAK